MRINSFQITNYKSFLKTEEVKLTSGFNVIVGQNNVGKTALLEAISLQFGNSPHRSLRTLRYRGAAYANPTSFVDLTFEISGEEFARLLTDRLPDFCIWAVPNDSEETAIKKLREAFDTGIQISTICDQGTFVKAQFSTDDPDMPMSVPVRQLRIDRITGEIQVVNSNTVTERRGTLGFVLAGILKNMIYRFPGERFTIGESQMGAATDLVPNAANLPGVLNYLHNKTPAKFDKFRELVRTILPEITDITIPPLDNVRAGIQIWTTPPEDARDDLAIPLNQSGTGIGQVLAILYVVLTSDFPRTIVIDEPQSFLHPGAIRKLFDVLKQFPQHQYILTTHSPTAIVAADPRQLLLVRKSGLESTIESINVKETQELRVCLSEVGVRLSDVFGADNILWVEGRTEELCFPLIWETVAKQQLLGTALIGVVQTGDLEGKHAQKVFDIYSRLSKGQGLLPPAIGFIFDQEGRTETEMADMKRQSEGRVHFLPRRMYENYLLEPSAIASVLTSQEGFENRPISASDVPDWIESKRWDKRYITDTPEADRTLEFWLKHGHGAKLLKDIFTEFTDSRIAYSKVEHNLMLTKHILENNPTHFDDIVTIMSHVIGR